MSDEVKIMERYILLLLGVVDIRPIPSSTHLQKELFVLTKANPKMKEFINFEKHHFGPYSDDINNISKNPIYYSDAFVFDQERKKYFITKRGKEIYSEIVRRYSKEPKFEELLTMMKMVRDLYDKLSTDELLFLIYATYGSYTEKSRKSEELLSPSKREKLARRLLKKGLITQKRYNELVTSG